MTSQIRKGPSGAEIVVLVEGDTVPVPPGGLGVTGAVLFWDGISAWVAPMAVGPTLGQVLTWDGAAWTPSASGGGAPTGPAGGGLNGTYPNPGVDGMTAGVLADDAAHGSRGGGSTHPLAIASGTAGYLSGADKLKLDNTNPAANASNLTTGVLTGGLLTAGAGVGEFSVALGTGRIVDYSNPDGPIDSPTAWAAQNNIAVTDIATTQFTFVLINPAGAVIQVSGTLTSETQRRGNILLGTLVHEDNVSITSILSRPDLAYNGSQDVKTITRRIAPFLLGGFTVTPIALSLTFSISSGQFWSEGTNFHTDPNSPSLGVFPASSPAVFDRVYTDGTSLGNTNFNGQGVTLVDPTNFDDAGVLTAVGGGAGVSTIQRLYLSPSGLLFLAYGQQTFANLDDAVLAAGQEEFVESLVLALSVVIGRFCVTRTATDLDDPADAVYVPAPIAGLGGGGSGTSTVFSVFGEVGIVVAAFGQYLASLIENDSPVAGTAVSDALGNLQTLGASNQSSGVLTGGNLTNGAGAGQVTISDGTGRVLDYSSPGAPVGTAVSWSGLTDIAITNIATTQVTFLLIAPGGTLLQVSGASPSESQYRGNVFLGWVEHPDNATITGIGADPQLGYQASQDFKTVLRAIAPFLINGFDVTPNASLTFGLSAGTFWAEGSQFHTTPNSPSLGTFAGTATLTFARIYSDGSVGGDTNYENTSTTLVDPTNVETSGVLGAVGGDANSSTIQRLYLAPNGTFYLAYGQATFSSLSDAVAAAGKEPLVESGLEQQSELLGRWCLIRTATDLTDEATAFYIPVGGGGGGSGGATEWIELTDTDNSFVGQAGRVPMVNLLENNLGLIDSTLKSFGAADFDEPNNANWAVASIAAINSDPQNTMFVDRTFDDSTDQGVGFDLPIPAGATTLRLFYLSRAQTAPGGAVNVTLDLYRRTIPDGVAQTAWSAALALTAIDIPASIDRVYDSQDIALSTLGLTAGTHAYFELVRTGGTLVGNWRLTEIWIGFA